MSHCLNVCSSDDLSSIGQTATRKDIDIVKRETIDAVRCLRVSRPLGSVPVLVLKVPQGGSTMKIGRRVLGCFLNPLHVSRLKRTALSKSSTLTMRHREMTRECMLLVRKNGGGS